MRLFPKIGQFRNAVKALRYGVENNKIQSRKIPYIGTVKLHGTNAAIRQETSNSPLECFSRKNKITPEQDNFGFATWVRENFDDLKWLFNSIRSDLYSERVPDETPVTVVGEWAGPQIQSGVGISSIPQKSWFIFSVRIGEEWKMPVQFPVLDYMKVPIYSIMNFPNLSINIDLDALGEAQQMLRDITLGVEHKCPVAKLLGYSGIGEGMVWVPVDQDARNNSDYWFKVKGEKHSDSKVKTLAPVDVEKQKSVDEFVDYVVTEHRLLKGIDHLNEIGKPVDIKSTGEFLKWFGNDVIEEESDTMAASMLEKRDVMKSVNNRAKVWFHEYLNKNF